MFLSHQNRVVRPDGLWTMQLESLTVFASLSKATRYPLSTAQRHGPERVVDLHDLEHRLLGFSIGREELKVYVNLIGNAIVVGGNVAHSVPCA